MTYEEFTKQDALLKEEFRTAIKLNQPDRALQLVRKHKELCKQYYD